MSFSLTWENRAYSIGPKKQQSFHYTALAGDSSISVSPPSLQDRVDYVLIDGVSRTSADSMSGTTATLAVKLAGVVTYTSTISAASAALGTQYYDAAGNQFSVAATITSATSVTLIGPAAVSPAGTLTKLSGGPAGDAGTLVISATVNPTLYGSGIAIGI